jgi:cation:H+ antiporter
MLGVIFWIAIFIFGLFLLIKSSDYFTDAAEKLGKFLRINPFLIGVTIVAFGTSLPELISAIFAFVRGNTEIISATIVGSNISNIFIIIGISAILAKKIKVNHEMRHVNIPFLIGSAFLLVITFYDGVFSFFEGLMFLVGLFVFTSFAMRTEKTQVKKIIVKKTKLGWKTPAILIGSSALIYFSASYVIEAIVNLSSLLSIGTEIIAASAVALGTSLPELTVTISAIKRNKPEIALGNIIGSNIFNTFAVMGVIGLFGGIVIPQMIITFALPMMVIATLMFFFMTKDDTITNYEGWLLLIFYTLYIVKLIAMAL